MTRIANVQIKGPPTSGIVALQMKLNQLQAEFDAYINAPDYNLPAEVLARQAGDNALQAQINDIADVSAQVDANTAAITTEQTVRASADSALASSVSTVSATVTTQGTTIAGHTTAIATNAASIVTEQTARASGDSALATSISGLSATVTTQGGTIAGNTADIATNAAAITSEASARATADSAIASSVTTLSASITHGGGNLLQNSVMGAGTYGWGTYTNDPSGNVAFTRDLAEPNYRPSPDHTLGIYQAADHVDDNNIWYTDIQIDPAKYYQISGLVASHRSTCFLRAEILDISGTLLATIYSSVSTGHNGGNDITGYEQLFQNVGSLSGHPTARILRFCFNKNATVAGQSDSYAWIVRPQVCEISAGQTVMSPYAPAGSATEDGLAASITTEQTARVSADSALASSVSTLTAALSTTNSNLSTLNATVSTNDTARVNGDNALAISITSLSATVSSQGSAIAGNTSDIATNAANITSEASARASADSAIASNVTSLSSTVSGHTTTITSHTASINGILAEYTVDIDLSTGVAGGFSLIGGGATIAAKWKVDYFAIQGVGGAYMEPFSVDTVLNRVTMTNVYCQNLYADTVVSEHLSNNSTLFCHTYTTSTQLGTGSVNTLFSTTETFAVDGLLDITYVGWQERVGGSGADWRTTIYIDGTIVRDKIKTGAFIIDEQFIISVPVTVGSHTVQVDWTGAAASSPAGPLELINPTLIIKGYNKVT